jgi:hypothetical protein
VFGNLRQPGASPTQGFFSTPAAAQVPYLVSSGPTNQRHPQSTDRICTSKSGPSVRACWAVIKAGWLYCMTCGARPEPAKRVWIVVWSSHSTFLKGLYTISARSAE